MNQRDRIESIVKQITYKPNWTFMVNSKGRMEKSAYTYIDGRIELWITCKVPDATTGKLVDISRVGSIHVYSLENMKDEDVVYHWIASEIRDMEEHEFREWFKYKGLHVIDPHPKGTKHA